MTDSTIGPTGPPWIPKSHKLQQAKAILEQLETFVRANSGYRIAKPDGWQHLRAVVDYLEWASHNQHIARDV